jgi:hypothetical protein
MRDRRLRFPKIVATRGTTSRTTNPNAAPIQGHTPSPDCVVGVIGWTGTGAGAGTYTGVSFSALAGSVSDRIAPVGQTERHASHPTHRLCSTRATPFNTLMASGTHTSVHKPQPVQRFSSTYTTATTFFLTQALPEALLPGDPPRAATHEPAAQNDQCDIHRLRTDINQTPRSPADQVDRLRLTRNDGSG